MANCKKVNLCSCEYYDTAVTNTSQVLVDCSFVNGLNYIPVADPGGGR